MTSEQAIARLTRRPPVGATELLASEPLQIDAVLGRARIAYLGKPEFCNEHGFIQGGFLSAMLDEVMAIAATAPWNFDYVVPTLGMKTSFLRPVEPGRLIAEGCIVGAGAEAGGGGAESEAGRGTRGAMGSREVYLAGELFNGDGELAATATATARFRKLPWK